MKSWWKVRLTDIGREFLAHAVCNHALEGQILASSEDFASISEGSFSWVAINPDLCVVYHLPVLVGSISVLRVPLCEGLFLYFQVLAQLSLGVRNTLLDERVDGNA